MATVVNALKVSQGGVTTPAPVATDLVEGNVVPNTTGLQLTVDNPGASAVTVTFKTSATVEGLAVADLTATVPAAGSKVFGRFSQALFGAQVEFTCSAACDVSATY